MGPTDMGDWSLSGGRTYRAVVAICIGGVPMDVEPLAAGTRDRTGAGTRATVKIQAAHQTEADSTRASADP